jgi:amino acid adenylation domain-containing protein
MIIGRIEEYAKKNGNKAAVSAEGRVLTYRQLVNRARGLATAIELCRRKMNMADHGLIVGLYLEHGSRQVEAAIGSLKAQTVFVPLDQAYPIARLTYMIRDTGLRIIVTERKFRQQAEEMANRVEYPIEIIDIDEIEELEHIEENGGKPIEPPTEPNNQQGEGGYIVYTSGTTGNPKGVLQTLENICKNAEMYVREFEISESDRLTYLSSFSTDGMFDDFFPTLLAGATICPLDIKNTHGIEDVPPWLNEEKITVYHSVTTVYRYLTSTLEGAGNPRTFPHLRLIITGGEPLRLEDVTRTREYFPGVRFTNLYAMTEVSVISVTEIDTSKQVDNLPMDHPVREVELLVLTEDGEEALEWERGEIFIAAPTIAVGYINNPETTAEVFLNDEELGRVYRTGDLGIFQLDERIQYTGRCDHQLKIRGFRVEPGEIENRLCALEGIEAAVVTGFEQDGEMQLCAYVQMHNSLGIDSVRTALLRNLPDHMMPTFFVPIEKMPQTATGKIDRQALPKPRLNTGPVATSPRNELEQTLANVWADVLKIEQGMIDIDATFFQLGGHSLRATVAITRIHKELNVKVPLAKFYKNPTIRSIAELIRNSTQSLHQHIPTAEIKASYPLSSAQKRLYVLEKFEGSGTSYNMSTVYRIKGQIDEDALENAIRALIERHETLRTAVGEENGEPVQRVLEPHQLPLPLERFQLEEQIGEEKDPVDPGEIQLRIEEKAAQFLRPFKLEQAPLFRVGLLKIPGEVVLMFDIHHIVSDGTSIGILVDDFLRAYEGETQEPMRIQYKDYAVWQTEQRRKGLYDSQEKYWLEQFADVEELPVLDIPTDKPRPAVYTFEGTRRTYAVNSETVDGIRNLAAKTGTTLYMQMLAALNILMHRYTGQEDIVIGTGIMGRPHVDLQPIIGMFVNTLAMRNKPTAEKTVYRFLEEVRENSITAFENQDVQFEDLVEKLNPPRDMSRNPLFDILMVVQNFEQGERSMRDTSVAYQPLEHTTAKFDLTIHINEAGNEIYITAEYRTALFDEETIQRMIRHLQQVMRAMVREPESAIGNQDIIPDDEKRRILYEFNDTEAEYPVEKPIHLLIEEQALRTPDSVAVVGQSLRHGEHSAASITYKEIDHRSRRLAARLRSRGIKPDTIVAIKMERNHEFIIGIIGIIRAGCAYLPIGPTVPPERIRYMLKESEARLLLKQAGESGLPFKIDCNIDCNIDCLDYEGLNLESGSDDSFNASDVDDTHAPERLCYIIYTSGSTGKPKGTMVNHRSLVNFCTWHNRYYEITPNDRFLQYSEIGFDGSLWDIFPCLMVGAELNIIPDERRLDISWMIEYFNKHQVSVTYLPTQYGRQFVEEAKHLPDMRRFFTGGEKLTRYVKRDYVQYNNYGPTENTILTTSHRMGLHPDSDRFIIPIGKPVSNNRLYILSRNRERHQPIGAVGELCIAGDSLSRGYLNNPELTAEKFIKCSISTLMGLKKTDAAIPAIEKPALEEDILYRTGDLARWLPDGNIDFVGRIDQQVKIRGFRIELEEIEARLLMHPSVKETVVIARKDKTGSKYICAYVVPIETEHGEPETIDVLELKKYLAGDLPDYMIPAHIVRLDEMPLTTSVKINRRALPEPEIGTGTNTHPPANRREKQVAAIWAEILETETGNIGVEDNFFDIGGHSLRATVVIARIHKETDVKIPMEEFFKNPTVRGQAEFIEKAAPEVFREIEPAEEKEYYPLTYNQQRLWFLYNMEPDSPGYHLTGSQDFDHTVTEAHIRDAMADVIGRHESFRTCIVEVDGEAFQRITDHVEIPLELIQLDDNCANPEEAARNLNEITARVMGTPFQLGKPPLFRAAYITYRNENREGNRKGNREGNGGVNRFVYSMHHIITDGWSMELLKQDFAREILRRARGENTAETQPPTRRYRDYAEWQHRYLENPEVKENSHRYWKKKMESGIPAFKLPADYDELTGGLESAAYRIVIDEGTKDSLLQQAKESNTTIYIQLLAILNIQLARHTGQQDIAVGILGAGREHHDIRDIVGFFVNALILTGTVDYDQTFHQYRHRVNRDVLERMKHQDYPLERVFDELKVRYPEISVMYNMFNMNRETAQIELSNTESGHMEKVPDAKFDVELYIMQYKNGIDVQCHYRKEKYKKERIQRMMSEYRELARNIARDPGKKIGQYFEKKKKKRRMVL